MKKDYIKPVSEIVCPRLMNSILEVGDLFDGSANEDSHEWWVGAKEQEFSTDETEDIWGMKTKDVWER